MEGDGLELGLGLSLSGGAGWGERGRILTARDFPYVGSKRSAADSVSNEGGGSPPRSSQAVGWPPVGAYRMNSLIGQPKTPSPGEEEEEQQEQEQEEEENQSKEKDSVKTKESLKKNKKVRFVKVNLDGMPIGRKVNLGAHACYESLAYSLEDMFFRSNSTISSLGNCSQKEKPRSAKLLDGSSEFVLTYEDKEGDWMLVGDVPWRMFLSSVRRLRIMRTSEANGLAPRFQEHRERQRARPV